MPLPVASLGPSCNSDSRGASGFGEYFLDGVVDLDVGGRGQFNCWLCISTKRWGSGLLP